MISSDKKKILLNGRILFFERYNVERENNYFLLSDYLSKNGNLENREMDEMAYGKIGRLVQPWLRGRKMASADNESTTTTIISLSQQMAHKHSRRGCGGRIDVGYGRQPGLTNRIEKYDL